MKSYTVDLTGARTFADVVEAFNAGLVRLLGEEWTGNLDAFNDFLWWPDEEVYELVLRGWTANPAGLLIDHAPSQRTYRDIIREIVAENTQVVAVYE